MNIVLRTKIKYWFDYLRLAHKSSDPSVISALEKSKEKYKSWGAYQTMGFDEWWKKHSHLFREASTAKIRSYKEGEIVEGNSFCLQIPLHYAPSTAAKIFKEILDGKDANEALGLKYKRGNTEGKAIARQKISLVLFWVACACESESDGGLGLTLNEAFIKASEVFEKFGYSPEMIEKYWYQEDKSHMRNALRGYFDQDSPL